MVRQDIVAALKNSIDRGYSLEQSKAVLINSGYSSQDVNEASSYVTGGIQQTPQSVEDINHLQQLPQQPMLQNQQPLKK